VNDWILIHSQGIHNKVDTRLIVDHFLNLSPPFPSLRMFYIVLLYVDSPSKDLTSFTPQKKYPTEYSGGEVLLFCNYFIMLLPYSDFTFPFSMDWSY